MNNLFVLISQYFVKEIVFYCNFHRMGIDESRMQADSEFTVSRQRAYTFLINYPTT